jgi:aminoglycoside phosphotransferase family enzyme
MGAEPHFVKLTHPRNCPLTKLREAGRDEGGVMAEPTERVRRELAERIAEIHRRAARLSPLDIHAQMDAIRETAALNGLMALEGLAHCSAQLALLPGHRVATQCCLAHMEEALESRSSSDCTTILAALAARLH